MCDVVPNIPSNCFIIPVVGTRPASSIQFYPLRTRTARLHRISDPISMPSLGMNAGQSATKPSMSMKPLFLVDRQSTEFEGLTFPLKLHIMLEEAQTLGFEEIIAWNSDGNGLQIHNVEAFTNSVMPQYFQQSKFKSFQRQLNMYGFKRMALGKLRGSYSQPLFVRGKPELCKRMVRRKAKPTPVQSPQQQQIHIRDIVPVTPVTSSDDSDTAFYSSRQTEITRSIDDGPWTIGHDLSATKQVLQAQDVLSRAVRLHRMNEVQPYCVSKCETINPASIEAFEPPRQPATPAAMARSLRGLDACGSENEQIMFPCKLHRMLHDAEQDGFEHIVSWVKNGRAFKVHDAAQFMVQVSPNYFDHSKYESLRRQLNIYGFHRVMKGEDRGQYSHPLFLRGRWDLCRQIPRHGNLPVPTNDTVPGRSTIIIPTNINHCSESQPTGPRVASSHDAIDFRVNPRNSTFQLNADPNGHHHVEQSIEL